MAIAENITSLVMGLLKPPSGVAPWDNSYWRRVSINFVGDDLAPASGPLRHQDLERFLTQVGKIIPDGETAMAKYRDRVQNIERQLAALEQLEVTLADTNESSSRANRLNQIQLNGKLEEVVGSISKQAAALETAKLAAQSARQVLEDSADHFGALGSNREWNALYHALDYLPSEIENPFESFVLLMVSLQAGGVAVILLALQYRELRSAIGLVGALVLIFIASYVQWKNYQFKAFMKDLAAPQIALMLRDIRRQTTHGVRRSFPIDRG